MLSHIFWKFHMSKMSFFLIFIRCCQWMLSVFYIEVDWFQLYQGAHDVTDIIK